MYEIPQQLEYKEKIIFGLTFSQLAYALIFLPIASTLFFKINASLSIRIFLTLIPTLLATGFMFFDLRIKIIDWYTWFRQRRLDTQEQIERTLEFGEVIDNKIVVGKKNIAVLSVEPINFSIKSKEEQETIIFTFQKLLNSIDFPIQILMTTETLDLERYLNSLETNMVGEQYATIFESYKNHMHTLVNKNSAMNRMFYVVIPEESNLDIQVKLVEERLHSLNLKTKRLIGNSLKRVFSQVTGESPQQLINNQNEIVINDKFHRVVYAYGYPRLVESGFLDKLVSCPGDFDISLHITPQSLEHTMIMLNKELQKQRADLYAAKLKNQFSPSLEIKYQDTKRILENLQKGSERLYNVSLYINCRAKTLEELNLLTKKVESELNSILILPKKPSFRMINGLKSCLPLAKDFLNTKRNVTTSALAAFFPFTSSFFTFDESGVWFGLNSNGIPVIRDIFKLSNSNGMCLASSGAGKSYLTKLFISRHLLNGTKVMVIDPQGEYKNLVQRFNGQRVDLSRTSQTIINPLDLMGHEYTEKRLSLMDLMPVMLGQLTEPQKSFIDQAITEAYERKGIYSNDKESWNNEPPILGDVLKILVKMEKKGINLEKSTLRSLINRLKLYVDGVFSFLNRHTHINFENDFTCFDIGSMPKQVKPVIMFLVLDYVYMKMKSSIERKLLVVDEAWSLLSRAEEASYIFEIVKTCRKFNMGLFLINQEVEGMLASEAGRSALANSSYTILLRQKPAVIDNIQKTFHLSNVERMTLLTAGVGEGLLLMEDEHSKIKIIASPEEHRQITTNADEILKEKPKQEIKPKNKNVEIKVDESIWVHKSTKLNTKEKEFLQRKGFYEFSYTGINSKAKEKYFIKPRFNESPQHLLLTYDIANYLKKFTRKIWLFETKKPDIVFEIKKERYAVEVETGKVFKKNKKQLLQKVKTLNQLYKNRWFFVLTNKDFLSNYGKLGETTDKRYVQNKLLKIYEKAKKSP